jgi:hypothetical protein
MKAVIVGFLMLAAAGSTANAGTAANQQSETEQKLAADIHALQVNCAELYRMAPEGHMPAACYGMLTSSVMLAGGVTVETTVLKECLAKAVAKQPQGQLTESLVDSISDACMPHILAVSKIFQSIGKSNTEFNGFIYVNYVVPAMAPAHPR